MGVRVKVDLTQLNKRFSQKRLRLAKLAMANEALQAMNKYVPSSSMGQNESGATLRGMTFVDDSGDYINYKVPYARAQFYGKVGPYPGYPVKHYTTPGTSKRWDLKLKGNKEEFKAVGDAFIKGLEWTENAD